MPGSTIVVVYVNTFDNTESNFIYYYVPELIQFQYMSYPVIGIPPSLGFIQLI